MSRDPPWKGANFSYRENIQGMPRGKQRWRVRAGTRMEACFPSPPGPTPHQLAGGAHLLSHPRSGKMSGRQVALSPP